MYQSSRSVWMICSKVHGGFLGAVLCTPSNAGYSVILWLIVIKQLQRKGENSLLHSETLYFKELSPLQETAQRQIDLTLSPVSFHILSHPIIFKNLCKKLRVRAALIIVTGKDKQRKKKFDPFMFSCTEHSFCRVHLHSIQRKITWNVERWKYENGSERLYSSKTLKRPPMVKLEKKSWACPESGKANQFMHNVSTRLKTANPTYPKWKSHHEITTHFIHGSR